MELGYCAGCRTVMYDPPDPKIFTEAELLGFYKVKKRVPEVLWTERALFVGFGRDPITGEVAPLFLPENNEGIRMLEQEKAPDQRVSWCHTCRSVRVFNMIAS